MADDVICLSSDDDFQPKKTKNKPTEVKKADKVVKKDNKQRKRKAPTELDTSLPKKRIQPTQIEKAQTSHSLSDDGIKIIESVNTDEPKKESSHVISSRKRSTSNDLNLPSTSKAASVSETIGNGPKLLIREKRPVNSNTAGPEVFAQFLSMCLTKNRSSEMKKIVEKLKRHYEQMDPDYAHSPAFIYLLNQKRDCLAKDGKYYVHINDIDTEMKCRKKSATTLAKKEETVAIEETIAGLSEENQRKVNILSKAMEKCRLKIKKLEDAEVDFNEEENSNYVKLSKYEERMSQIFYKYCELTGDDKDAGRRYLRPKSLKVTQIEEVDQAIISFINKKLKDKRKRTQKGFPAADCVIFPDYCDILKCIQTCNAERSLGMTKKSMEKLAEKAFTDLGNHLQKVRREDLMDSFALMLEEESDPAQHDSELLRKLDESKLRGKKKLDAVFEEFITRQDEGLLIDDEDDTGSHTEDDEETSLLDEDNHDDGQSDLDIDSISQQGSVDTTLMERSLIDPLEIEEDPLKVDVLMHDDPLTMGEVSDSAETVILSPPRSQKVVPNVEGAVTDVQNILMPRIKTCKPGPKSSKMTSKPSITNIENVRVVIKAHDIVRIKGKVETNAVLNKSTSDIVKQTSVSEDQLMGVKSLSQSIGDSKNDHKIDIKEKAQNAEVVKRSTIVTHENENIDTVAKTACEILQQKTKIQTIIQKNSLEMVASVENQEITSSTEGNIDKSKLLEITLVGDEPADTADNAALTENDSPLPDSTLKVADVEDTKEKNQFENDARPVLKLRAFAKTPDFWDNSVQKQNQNQKIKSTEIVKSNMVEVVDLEDGTVQTTESTVEKPRNIAGTASASASESSLLPVRRGPSIIKGRTVVKISIGGSTVSGVLKQVSSPTKTRIIGDASRAKILPMATAQSTPSRPQYIYVTKPPIKPIQNTTVGSSSVLQKLKKSVCINPVNRQLLTSSSPDRLVNPVSMRKIIKKRQ